MTEHVQTWLDERASTADDWQLQDLIARKNQTVAVVLPALNEAATVGQIVQTIHDELFGTLVDDLVVLDSGSTDDTAAVAKAHGARVVALDSVFPGLPSLRGKGEAMWRALAATDADLVVFIDADLRSFTASYVTGLLGPLLTDPDVHLVKAVYERPLVKGDSVVAAGGGRVTELVARPLLAALRPELGCVIQPLSGEYAGTRELLTSLPFAPGYGVEIGILIDTYDRLGLDAIAQVNLGVRAHRNRPLVELGAMSRQVMATLLSRCGIADSGVGLTQFLPEGDGFELRTTSVSLADRPPMNTLR